MLTGRIVFETQGQRITVSSATPWNGVQRFQGTCRQECYSITTGLILAGGGICSQEPGAGVALCPSTHQCLPLGKGRYQGIVSFDNVGAAVMTVLQIVTLQGWTRVMDEMQAAQSSWVAVYFVVLILVCMRACANACASGVHVMHGSRGSLFTASCASWYQDERGGPGVCGMCACMHAGRHQYMRIRHTRRTHISDTHVMHDRSGRCL